MRSLLLGLSTLALMGAAPAPDTAAADKPVAAPVTHHMGIAYRGYLLGIAMLSANVNAAYDDDSYKADAVFETAGLAALLKQVKVVAQTQGERDGANLITRQYHHQELDGHKNRKLSMNYGKDAVKVRIEPPIRHMGDPPATQAQMLEASDAISAILEIALQAGTTPAAQQCSGVIKVFDGKQRYDLVLTNKGLEHVRTRAYSGKALKCEVRNRPVAGFNADDLEKTREEYDHPINMWLAEAQTGDMRLPVRFSYVLPFGTAVVEAKQIETG